MKLDTDVVLSKTSSKLSTLSTSDTTVLTGGGGGGVGVWTSRAVENEMQY